MSYVYSSFRDFHWESLLYSLSAVAAVLLKPGKRAIKF